MVDNGLLKYYKSCPSEDGFLDVSTIGLERREAIVSKTRKCTLKDRNYYLKVHFHNGTISKPLADSEILLSQIYTKLGISSAIYLPAKSKSGKFLLCNDVEEPNVVLATDFLEEKLHSRSRGPKSLPFLSKTYSGKKPERLYTRNAMTQQTKLRILDTATYNTDRHLANFFYALEHPSPFHYDYSFSSPPISKSEQILNYFRSLRPNKAQDVVAIDFESSGGNYLSILETEDGLDEPHTIDRYMNDFQVQTMSREKMLHEFSTNEKLAEVLDKPAFAEELGSLDIGAVAEDILDTTGYEVDKKFVEVLSQSCEEVAESLMQ